MVTAFDRQIEQGKAITPVAMLASRVARSFGCGQRQRVRPEA
jgi:hypothetical protein